ncbi:MAG: hypothetical protein ACRD26_01485, partial [Vicinamibacterales bacterium]
AENTVTSPLIGPFRSFNEAALLQRGKRAGPGLWLPDRQRFNVAALLQRGKQGRELPDKPSGICFNEAALLQRGKRLRVLILDHRHLASMRPRSFSAENERVTGAPFLWNRLQ